MAEVKEKKSAANPKQEYIYTVGRHKKAIATVRLYKKGKGEITVNEKSYKDYFSIVNLQNLVALPLTKVGLLENHDVTVKVLGGGKKGQAESIRLGIARALVKLDEDLRASLKKDGLLTRDSRVKERKKPGLKRARRAPQWSKR